MPYSLCQKDATALAGNRACGPALELDARGTDAMFECLILGDSLAKGTADALADALRNRCEVVATTGAGSAAILRAVPARSYKTATISAGSNDPRNPYLADNLIAIRQSLAANHVVWIAPYNRSVAYLVRDLARSFGDSLVDVAETAPCADGLHPQSYSRLARLLAEGGFAGR